MAQTVHIRPVRPADATALTAFYAGLSRDAFRARFFSSARSLAGAAVGAFCTPDHQHDEGFVAVADPNNEIVGHVCLAPAAARRVELGIAVADAYQGLGLGHRLFEMSIAWARDLQLDMIVATCFADNSRVLALLAAAPGSKVSQADGGVVDVFIPVSGSAATLAYTRPSDDTNQPTPRWRPAPDAQPAALPAAGG